MFENENPNLLPAYLSGWRKDEVHVDLKERVDDESEILIWYTLDDEQRIPVAAKSEIMVVTGREKSRKTLLMQCMIMSHYTSDTNVTMKFSIEKEDLLIYYFDTEQPVRRTKKNLKRFYEICGVENPDPNYKVFNLRKYSYSQKLEVITHIIEELFEETGRHPDMIVIDQIADLAPARDVNDQSGADNVLTYVTKWQEITGALMALVIHTNRGGQNSNGKLGVIFDQKADCQFLIDINEDGVSTVRHKLARDNKVPQFTFRQDFSGRPRLLRIIPSNFD